MPIHAYFCRIVPEIGENAATADVDIILQHGIPDIGKVCNGNTVANEGTFHFHRMANDAVIANLACTSYVRIGTYAAIFSNADMPIDDATGFDDGAFSQLQHALYHGGGVDGAVVHRLQVQQLLGGYVQPLPWGDTAHRMEGKSFFKCGRRMA